MNGVIYCTQLRQHYENYYGISGEKKICNGQLNKLPADFYVLEFPPNNIHNFWAYSTIGMPLNQRDGDKIELFIYSPFKDESLVEILAMFASFHRNDASLNLHHTVNIGKPWLNNSSCDHAFISLPYLDGENLEIFTYNNEAIKCLWVIPITEREREYKKIFGVEALEEIFDLGLDYLNPLRKSLV